KDTDRDGDFSCAIVIPESTAGEHSITVTDESGSEDEAVFTVKPEITAVITKGPGGYTVTLKGGGFAGNSQVAISFEDNEVIEDETGKYGSFEVTFPVPVESSGSYEVEAEDEDKNSDRTKFTIAGVITISPENSNAGSQVTVSGSGFKPYTSVSISYADDAGPAVVASSTSDAQGSFSTAFTIPESKHGAHIISATDGSNTGTAMFTMESTPPSTPLPLAPETGDRTKPEARFDWDAVNDPSGVSYTLQIAIDAEFSESSIVLEKTGLLQSEYTLSEEENLEPTDKEMPYYWRVMAVDGAANEGTASEPVSFSVRSGLPAPPRAVLYVLGALLIGFAGFWVGKRYGLRRAIG
ncbi:MAG: hypothetical protein U9Q17_01115, partial [Chloroflexota bacterium]|nr:hypothetical protein [Chloroflexota bacterium]